MTTPDFLPTADLEMLRLRAKLLAAVRRFFDVRGYWEVETPILSHDIVVDAHLDPFVVPAGYRGRDLYLQTSPEFAMKRLLAAGADAIYQIAHVFRHGERGRLHNPEFTMVEWYRVGDTHHAQMDVVEALVREMFAAAGGAPPHTAARDSSGGINSARRFLRTTYAEAFRQHVGIEVFDYETSRLAELAAERGLVAPESLRPDDRDGWLNLLLAELVEPRLGRDAPEFLYDYPASQGALARVRAERHPVAERFELYLHGIELCNGYHELTDAAELRRRNGEQLHIRQEAGSSTLPVASRLLEAMEHGLPDSAGVALGFDRVAMLAAGKTTIDEVVAFPIDRA
jgi:lysyl-tRNA synthetase class 2